MEQWFQQTHQTNTIKLKVLCIRHKEALVLFVVLFQKQEAHLNKRCRYGRVSGLLITDTSVIQSISSNTHCTVGDCSERPEDSCPYSDTIVPAY